MLGQRYRKFDGIQAVDLISRSAGPDIFCLAAGPPQVVAVKVVRTSKQVERRMALQEVRINQMISHIAIVRFEQAWTDLGCVYSVFELCSTNLSAYIDNLQATRWVHPRYSSPRSNDSSKLLTNLLRSALTSNS